jgi:hypothetical protein
MHTHTSSPSLPLPLPFYVFIAQQRRCDGVLQTPITQ